MTISVSKPCAGIAGIAVTPQGGGTGGPAKPVALCPWTSSLSHADSHNL